MRPSTTTNAAETRYVPEILGMRPTVSKNRPKSSGPRKLPAAKITIK
jgi:hypothetical protein